MLNRRTKPKLRKVKEWLEELPEPNRGLALYYTAELSLESLAPNCHVALAQAFIWTETVEGGQYWNKVHDSLYRKTI